MTLMVTPSEELTTTMLTMTLSEELATPMMLRHFGLGKGAALTFRPRPHGRDPNVTASSCPQCR